MLFLSISHTILKCSGNKNAWRLSHTNTTHLTHLLSASNVECCASNTKLLKSRWCQRINIVSTSKPTMYCNKVWNSLSHQNIKRFVTFRRCLFLCAMSEVSSVKWQSRKFMFFVVVSIEKCVKSYWHVDGWTGAPVRIQATVAFFKFIIQTEAVSILN